MVYKTSKETRATGSQLALTETTKMIIKDEIVKVQEYLKESGISVTVPKHVVRRQFSKTLTGPMEASYFSEKVAHINFNIYVNNIDRATPEVIRAYVAHEMWHHVQYSLTDWDKEVKIHSKNISGSKNTLENCMLEGLPVFFEAVYLTKDTKPEHRAKEIFKKVINFYSTMSGKEETNPLFALLMADMHLFRKKDEVKGLNDNSRDILDYLIDKSSFIEENEYSMGSILGLLVFINNNYDVDKTLHLLSTPKAVCRELSKINKSTLNALLNITTNVYELEKRESVQ